MSWIGSKQFFTEFWCVQKVVFVTCQCVCLLNGSGVTKSRKNLETTASNPYHEVQSKIPAYDQMLLQFTVSIVTNKVIQLEFILLAKTQIGLGTRGNLLVSYMKILGKSSGMTGSGSRNLYLLELLSSFFLRLPCCNSAQAFLENPGPALGQSTPRE